MGFLRRLSIQSKLLVMLLGVSIASIMVVAYIGYQSGRQALVQSIRNQLSGLCQVKSTSIQNQLKTLKGQVITLSADDTFLRALQEFKKGFAELNDKPIPAEWDQKLSNWYQTDFLPKLRLGLDSDPVLETYVPRIPASRHLQYQYIVKNTVPYLKKGAVDSSGEDTGYDATHKKYHPFFRLVASSFGFEDIMLIDSESGEIVYSEQKTTEFATNLLSGPYSASNLAALFREIQKGMDRDDYRIVDFERYRPNLNAPASFIASPIFDGNKMVGVLAIQFPDEQINRIMTGNHSWASEGLGKTGETYLVGTDLFMRSRSRELYEDREGEATKLKSAGASEEDIEKARKEGVEAFLAKMKSRGTTEQGINRIRSSRTAVLALRVNSEAAREAVAGKSDTIFQPDYRGMSTLASFKPLEIEGLLGGEKSRWGVVAKIDLDEALEPVYDFRRRVLTTAVIIMLLVTLLAFLLSRIFTRPLKRLAQGAHRVSEGEVDVKVDVRSEDEFREVAEAFNKMTTSLKAKTEQLDQKIRENEELILNILPSAAARRHREGQKQVSETFADVTVLFANLAGLSHLSATQSPDQVMGILNELVVAFDEAAERHGVEKVKTVGESYMAVCGLSVQRPDHTNRMVEFARELLRIARRFEKDRGLDLRLSIAINSGPVVGGVVGQSKFIYDLWGDTVQIARGMQSQGKANTIQVTEDVHDRLGDIQEFEALGQVEIPSRGSLSIWGVKA